jgi:3-hydroxyisobutyrate dehydrogenase-like beta-hydroxyacid dehydrogenase
MSDTGTPVIGFIGLGAMGLPMTRCLLRAGFRVAGWDIRDQPLRQLGNQITVARSAQEVGDLADIVLGCLPTLDAYRSAILGEAGLCKGARVRTYIHLGTTGAALVADLVASLSPRVAVLDAPITGGVAKAVDGTLTTIASGAPETLASVRAVLDAYSARIVPVGEAPGSAQVMKLVNNIMSLTSLAAASEAMLVGAKAGLDPRVMLEVLNNGSGQSNATLTKIPLHVLPRSFDFGGSLAIALKDSGQFLKEAEGAGVSVEICRAVAAAYHRTAAEEGIDVDMTAVIRPMERQAGFELPQSPHR